MIALPENSSRPGWFKFRIAEALGIGEHMIWAVFPGPPVLVVVNGPDYDDQDRPSADIEAYHPDIDGIGWEDIWEAVRRQYPDVSSRKATDPEYQAIKESIATFGSLQRVVVDEVGNIIAGRLRKRACTELGVQCPTEVISGLTPDQKEQLSFELDFCRKHLSLPDKRRAAEFILKSNPRNTDRVIGRACGLDHKTVGGIREDLEGRGEIPQVQQRQGGDGKTYKFPKIVANTQKEEDRAKSSLQELGEDAPAKHLDLRKAEGLVRIKRANERREARNKAVPLPDDAIRIVHGDFRTLDIEDFSIPLILTDPPYDRAALPLWMDLADFAARKLRPGGLLVAYSGVIFLPEVYAALSAKLQYHWQHVLLHAGERQLIYERRIGSRYKPILVFSQGPVGDLPMLQDVIQGIGAEKDFHDWQQNIGEAIHFIEAYTKAGDLVVDPFGGGFTTAAACYRLGRRCLSCDIDAEAVQKGLERLAQEREQRENNK
jgi:ParB-like chromosome segregation protein Spo0J